MFISTGSFIIRGKRNFITPQRLELGFTVVFCLGEESLAGHIGERKPREDLDAVEAELQKDQNKDYSDMPPLELVKKDSSLSHVSVSVEGGDENDIKIV
jgi:hypothetical protein